MNTVIIIIYINRNSEICDYSSNGIEETLEESSHEPEPELESESKTEELKTEVEEKNLEEVEKKSPSPPPVETVSLPQEPPKVG